LDHCDISFQLAGTSFLIDWRALRAGQNLALLVSWRRASGMVVRRSFPFLLSRDGHGSYSTFRFGTRRAPNPVEASSVRRF